MEVSICLTFTGTTNLGPTMNAYSDVDNYVSPIGGPISVSNLVPNNCPYTLTGVPDGATRIRLVSTTSPFCCVNLIVGAFNICEVCENLGFSAATNPNIGQLSLGSLTGSCDNNISNFYLEWYGPGTGSTQLQFTSGLGTSYATPTVQHPLTGSTSPYLYPGEYRPVIKEIEINNVIYSNAYGAYGDCFQNSPFVVSPYTIGNGSLAPEPYQHCLDLNINGTQPSTGLVQLSGGTNYVPFRLDGGEQADLLRIYFSGASYLTPIPLESITIGNFAGLTQLNTEFDMTSPNINYKTFGGAGSFTKVLCLTGLTRSANDVLIFEITPQGTAPTDFTFCFTQLGNFDCEMCALTRDYTNYKIVQSSISAITGSNQSTQITFSVSGCPTNADINEDLYKYIFSGSGSASVGNAYGSVNKTINLIAGDGGLPGACSIQSYTSLGSIQPACTLGFFGNQLVNISVYTQTAGNGTITRYITIDAQIKPGNGWYEWMNAIYDSFNSTIAQATASGIYNNNDPLNSAYWSTISLHLPYVSKGIDSFNTIIRRTCWDNALTPAQNDANLAYDAIIRNNDTKFTFAANNVYCQFVTSDIDPVFYTKLVIKGFNFVADEDTTIIPRFSPNADPSCILPGNVFSIQRDVINQSFLDTSQDTLINGITFNPQNPDVFFAYNENPWSYQSILQNDSGAITTAQTLNRISMYQYENKTFPLTGTTGAYGVLIADTATTCPNITNYTFDENSGSTSLNNYVRYNYVYNFSYIDNSDNTKYKITATPISSNGKPTTAPPTLIGSGTTAPSFTVIDPTYFI